MLFLGEDLYQQKRVRSMIYRYDDSYFRPLDLEDVSLDMVSRSSRENMFCR